MQGKSATTVTSKDMLKQIVEKRCGQNQTTKIPRIANLIIMTVTSNITPIRTREIVATIVATNTMLDAVIAILKDAL